MADASDGSSRGEARRSEVGGRAPEDPGRSTFTAWNRRRTLLVVAGIAVAVVGGVLVYLLLHAGEEETDDAYVDADVVALAPRVAGRVAAVPVVENQRVKEGQLVLQLDDRDYQARVAQASAALDSARAQAEAADSRVAVAEAAARGSLTEAEANLRSSIRSAASARARLEQARANLASQEADLELARTDLRRARDLWKARAIPRQQLDRAEARHRSAAAAVEAGRASVTASEEQLRRAEAGIGASKGRVVVSEPVSANIAVARADAANQHARVRSAEAALELARLDLEWTRLVAPGDGVVSDITSHPASLVAVGQVVAQFVPAKKYVTANFKETQVGKMHPGQRADVDVDTYDRTLRGTVESLSGGTGARFSLLPPENATGNFVKIAQRIPVRIALDGVPAGVVLRAGQSVEVTVHVSD